MLVKSLIMIVDPTPVPGTLPERQALLPYTTVPYSHFTGLLPDHREVYIRTFCALLLSLQSLFDHRILPEINIDLIVPRTSVGVRVSAPMRRGAAPYGNGCEQISGHSHLISQCILSASLDFRAAFYATF